MAGRRPTYDASDNLTTEAAELRSRYRRLREKHLKWDQEVRACCRLILRQLRALKETPRHPEEPTVLPCHDLEIAVLRHSLSLKYDGYDSGKRHVQRPHSPMTSNTPVMNMYRRDEARRFWEWLQLWKEGLV